VVVVNHQQHVLAGRQLKHSLVSAPALHQLHSRGTGAQTYLGQGLHQPPSQVG